MMEQYGSYNEYYSITSYYFIHFFSSLGRSALDHEKEQWLGLIIVGSCFPYWINRYIDAAALAAFIFRPVGINRCDEWNNHPVPSDDT